MTLTRLQLRLLVALFDLAQADRAANVKRLAEHLDLRFKVVAIELNRLDELGLVHAGRVRLSMSGLVLAAGARSRLGARGTAALLAA